MIFFVHSTVIFTFSVLFLFDNIWRFFTSHFVGAEKRRQFSQKWWKKTNHFHRRGLLQKRELTKNIKGLEKQKNWTKHQDNLWPSYKRYNHHCLPCRNKDPSCCRENFQELASLHFNSKIFSIYANWKPINLDITLQVCLLPAIF